MRCEAFAIRHLGMSALLGDERTRAHAGMTTALLADTLAETLTGDRT
jgi:hypothetical protein